MQVKALYLCSLALACLGEAAAQDFPGRPIRILVTGAGSSGDLSARSFGPRISAALGQPVIVENIATAIIADQAAKAPPDGYTLLMDASSLWIAPLLQPMRYDVLRDFAPIATTDRAPNLLSVTPSLPVNSVKELIALSKAKPGSINFGTGQPGTAGHLASEYFKSVSGADITRVSYKVGVQAITAAVTGEVHMVFSSIGSQSQHIKSGKLRALGVASLQPSGLVPGIPTIASQGLPGFEAALVQGVLAPAKTPDAIIRRLNREIVAALSTADMREKYLAMGIEASPSTPEEFAGLIKSEVAKWSKVIKEAGIKAD